MAIRDGGFAGAGSGRLESPGQRPSASPGAGRTTGSAMGGYGADRTMGTGFRGPTSTWGSSPSVVAGSALGQSMLARQRQAMSPMAPYGTEFSFTPDEMASAFISEAPVLFGTPTNPSLGQLQKMGQQIQASPELTSMLGAINAPFSGTSAAPATAPDAGLLSGALDASLPSGAASMSAVPSQATYSGPKGVAALNPAARYASVRSQGLNVPAVPYDEQSLDLMTRIALAESSAIRNPMGETSVPALQGVMDVMRNRVLSEQFPDTLTGVLTQSRQFEPYGSGAYANYGPESPNYSMARSLAESVLRGEAAPVVGGAMNFGNVETIQSRPTSVTSPRTKAAFAAMAADPASVRFVDAMNPGTFQHTFGVLPGTQPISFGGPAVSPAALPASAPVVTAAAAPVTPVAPIAPTKTTAATPMLPPRSATPGVVQSMLANFLGMPAYSRGASTNAATLGQPQNPSAVANLATGLLASAAPAPAPAAPAPVEGNRGEPFQYVPIELATAGATPVGEVPEVDFSLAMPEWYQQWLQSNSGLLA